MREDVGTGKDYKQASTDAFKRAAVRFGIGHELYQLGTNWVELESGAKGARPVEDPQRAHERRAGATRDAASRRSRAADGADALARARRGRAAGRSRVSRCAAAACGTIAWTSEIPRRPTSSAAIVAATAWCGACRSAPV